MTFKVELRADSFEYFSPSGGLTVMFNTSQMSEALKPLRKKRDFLSIAIQDGKMIVETLGDTRKSRSTSVVDLDPVDPVSHLKILETFDVSPHVVRSSLFHKICKIESDLSDLLTLRKIGDRRISITSQIEGVVALSAELGCGSQGLDLEGDDSELVVLTEGATGTEPGVELPALQLIGLSETVGVLTDKLYIHFGEFGGVMLRSHVGTLGEMFAYIDY